MIESILIVMILVALLVHSIRRPKNFPPGPTPTPIIGSFHKLDQKNPQKSLDEYHEMYGPYVGLILGGGFRAVIVNGLEAVCEAFGNDDLLGRPDVCLIRDRFDGENYGILFTDGDTWKTQRRFTLCHFRNLGFGRKSHESVIQEEAEALLDLIREKQGKAFFLEERVSTCAYNVIWSLLGGKRYAHSEKEMKSIASNVHDCVHSIKMFGSLAVAFPFLRYIFPERMGYKGLTRGSRGLRSFMQQAIKEHEMTRDADNPRDFIDIYLEELQKPDADPSFSTKQLEGICMDMLLAGGDTSLSVSSFAILFLCLRKDLQEKVYEEILQHVGKIRIPSTEDKANLVYTEAVIIEILRMRTPAPTTIPRRALRHTTLGGYHIPKDTLVISNLNSIFMEKSYWKDPETFRPERFITSEGKLKRDERLIPFGKGKRMCTGEALARSSSFIFIASMIQNFSFSLDPNMPIPKPEGIPGFTIAAPFFQVVATPRK